MPQHATKTSFKKGYIPANKGVFLFNDGNELRRLYWDEKMSANDIAKLKGVTPACVLGSMIRLNVSRRSGSEARQLAHKQGKLKNPPVRFGKDNNAWKGGIYHKNGYVLIYNPNHPRANPRYVPEHILVWEETHGKYLPEGYVVHHLNGIKDDNRRENLTAVPKPQHEKNTLLKLAHKRIRELETQIGVL